MVHEDRSGAESQKTLDTEFLAMVDKMGAHAVADDLGMGASTIYAQAAKIRDSQGPLSGDVRLRFLDYRRRTQALEGAEDGADHRDLTRPPEPPRQARQPAAQESSRGTLVDWSSMDLTDKRRQLRVEADRHADVADHNDEGDDPAHVGRVGGVVREHPYTDESDFFGSEVAGLLSERRHYQMFLEQACEANSFLAPYEFSVYEQSRLRAQIDLKRLDFSLIDDNGLTLPPHTAPYGDMQRSDALEHIASDVRALEVALNRERRTQTLLDILLVFMWWPLRASPRPVNADRRMRGRGAAETLRYVDSLADAIAARYPTLLEVVEARARQRAFVDFLHRRASPSKWVRPYERLLDDLARINAHIKLLLLEHIVARAKTVDLPQLHETDDDATLTGVVAHIHRLMVKSEYYKSLRFVVNCILLAPWWVVRPFTLMLPGLGRKRT